MHLHYLDVGEGPVLVLLHGLGSMVEELALSGLIDQAARRFRVLAFDRPGYGRSERPARRAWGLGAQSRLLRGALLKLGVRRPIVAGHSWGALLAAAFALQYPGAARSLLLMSGVYFPSLRLDAPLLMPPAVPVVGTLLRHTVSPLLGRLLWPAWVRMIFAPRPVPRRFGAFPTWMALRPSQLRAVGQDSAATLPATLALRRRYAELKLPVVIFAGEQDRYVDTRAHSVRLHAALPHSGLVLVPGAGHMAHHADPAGAIAAIEAAGSMPP